MHLGLKYMVRFNSRPSRTTVEGFLMTKAEISSKRDRKRPMHSGKRWKASWGWEGLAADHTWGAASPSRLPSWVPQSGSRMQSGLCPRKEVPPPGSEEELTLWHRGQQQLWEAVPDHPGLKSPTQYTRLPSAPKLLFWPHGRHSRLTNILAPCLNGNKTSSWSPSQEETTQVSSKNEKDKDSPLWPSWGRSTKYQPTQKRCLDHTAAKRL